MNKSRLDQGPDYERGFVDGMQHQMQSSVDKAVNRMAQPEQEPVPPPWWPAVENILNEYGLQAIDFVADFKQALAQTQEPVALQYPQKDIDWQREQQIKAQASTPPQRTWVGLTDEEICEIEEEELPWREFLIAFAQAIEAKLKEKNT